VFGSFGQWLACSPRWRGKPNQHLRATPAARKARAAVDSDEMTVDNFRPTSENTSRQSADQNNEILLEYDDMLIHLMQVDGFLGGSSSS
jgi:hypothetical protein